MQTQQTAEQLTGELVRHHRIAHGYSQQVLADAMTALGFSWHQTTVTKTEAAERPIRVNELAGLARVLDVPAHQLVEEPPDVAGGRVLVELLRAKALVRDARDAARKATEELDAAEERFRKAQKAYTAAERKRDGRSAQG